MLPDRRIQRTSFRRLPLESFTVPTHWQGKHSLLIPVSPRWVELDYEAVMESRSKLQHLFGATDPWPPENLDSAANQADLAWHAREFENNRSFAYHLLSHDRQTCLGCLYVYPTASHEHDAEAYLWTHISLSMEHATLIEDEVINWINTHWPFENMAWPGRFITFEEWGAAALPNYYATMR